MSRWRRPAAIVLVGLVVAGTCVLLGRWQWHRHVAKDAAIATVERNWQAPAVPIEEVLHPGGTLTADQQWRTVTVTGRYEAASTVLLRGRTVDGQGVYHVLVPFTAADGTVLVVDRGWIPAGDDPDSPSAVPAAPPGAVALTGRLVLAEPSVSRPAPAAQVRSTAVREVLAAGSAPVAGPVDDAVVQMTSESPAAATLGTLPEPSLDPGPHLSYAFQWWAFAVMAIGGFGWAARREWLDPQRTAPAPPVRRAGRDELDEDALIDAQLTSQSGDREPTRHRTGGSDPEPEPGRDRTDDAADSGQARVTRSR